MNPPNTLHTPRDLYIRRSRPSDAQAVSRICLLTADAGNSSENKHTIAELPGLCYAVPYLHLSHSGGFVLIRPGSTSIDDAQLRDDDGNIVVAYVVFTTDTVAFNSTQASNWFPSLRVKYPLSLLDSDAPFCGKRSDGNDLVSPRPPSFLLDKDIQYIKLLHTPEPPEQACLTFSPAHMHINVLPPYQRQGWGRRLLDSVVAHLRDEHGLHGIWLGMDPSNHKAALFYEKIGFRHENVIGAPQNFLGLKFSDWTR